MVIGVLAVSAVSILGTVVWIALRPQYEEVPLTKGLRGDWSGISTELERRARLKFPIGSSVLSMGEELRREGFSRQDWNTSVDDEHVARRQENDVVCNKAAYIFWRADDKGRVTAIRGLYREEGCL
jgi:hypothetical protein